MNRSILFTVCFSVILLCGCAQSKDSVQTPDSITLLSAEQISSKLNNSGWDVQDTTAGSFHMWEQLDPTILILAENSSDQALIIGEFKTAENARLAYQATVPTSSDLATNEDTDTYYQSLVRLSDGSGYWLFRQTGKNVLGAFMPESDQQAEFESLFDSLETSSASQTADNS